MIALMTGIIDPFNLTVAYSLASAHDAETFAISEHMDPINRSGKAIKRTAARRSILRTLVKIKSVVGLSFVSSTLRGDIDTSDRERAHKIDKSSQVLFSNISNKATVKFAIEYPLAGRLKQVVYLQLAS